MLNFLRKLFRRKTLPAKPKHICDRLREQIERYEKLPLAIGPHSVMWWERDGHHCVTDDGAGRRIHYHNGTALPNN